jgi:hypothetical protein
MRNILDLFSASTSNLSAFSSSPIIEPCGDACYRNYAGGKAACVVLALDFFLLR